LFIDEIDHVTTGVAAPWQTASNYDPAQPFPTPSNSSSPSAQTADQAPVRYYTPDDQKPTSTRASVD